ncbi:hypothetical protein DIPPA_26680 [Diplonema papillatum]|nr:hypothetical protein DIPPA_26680 [Diplonema papillatum]
MPEPPSSQQKEMPLPVWRNRSPAAGPQEQLARLVAACRDDTAEQPAAEGCTAGVTPGALGEAVACVSRLRARVAALEHENAALRGGQKPPAASDGASAWGEVQEAKRANGPATSRNGSSTWSCRGSSTSASAASPATSQSARPT